MSDDEAEVWGLDESMELFPRSRLTALEIIEDAPDSLNRKNCFLPNPPESNCFWEANSAIGSGLGSELEENRKCAA